MKIVSKFNEMKLNQKKEIDRGLCCIARVVVFYYIAMVSIDRRDREESKERRSQNNSNNTPSCLYWKELIIVNIIYIIIRIAIIIYF
jgi:hypothetical protein